MNEDGIEAASEAFDKLLTGDTGKQDEDEQEAVDAAEEADGDDQPEDAAEEEQDAEETEDDEDVPALLTVKIDGKEQQLPVDEVVKGYQRNADYTRKTQEIAERRKAADSELESAKAEREHYRQNLARVIEMQQQSAPQEPNWVQLAQTDPTEYVRQHALWTQHKVRQSALEAEAAQVQAKAEEEDARVAAEHRAAEKVKLFDAIPEWKDARKLKSDKAALEDFAVAVGFTAEDVSEVNDHRILVILRDAMLYRRGLAARKAQGQTMPPQKLATPGVRDGGALKGVRAREMATFKQTGAVEDAAKLFERLM